MRLGVKGEVSVVCDALFKHDNRFRIVEIDYMQKMNANKAKIQKYKRLLELGVFDKPPVFIWTSRNWISRCTNDSIVNEIVSRNCKIIVGGD
jgi:hypothetical protein